MTVSCVTRERERDDRGWVEIDISKNVHTTTLMESSSVLLRQ